MTYKNDFQTAPEMSALPESQDKTTILQGLLELLNQTAKNTGPGEFKVFFFLARRTWERKQPDPCQIGYREIEAGTGLNVKTIIRLVRSLERKNLIGVIRDTPKAKGNRETNAPNQYWITGQAPPPKRPRVVVEMPTLFDGDRV